MPHGCRDEPPDLLAAYLPPERGRRGAPPRLLAEAFRGALLLAALFAIGVTLAYLTG
jgi:hypothetical protein